MVTTTRTLKRGLVVHIHIQMCLRLKPCGHITKKIKLSFMCGMRSEIVTNDGGCRFIHIYIFFF